MYNGFDALKKPCINCNALRYIFYLYYQ